MIKDGEKDYTEGDGDWFFPKVKEEVLEDYKDILDQHKNELVFQQKFAGGGKSSINSHHMFYHPVIDKELALFYLRECNLSYQSPDDRAEEVV